jgi:hypothetical protein
MYKVNEFTHSFISFIEFRLRNARKFYLADRVLSTINSAATFMELSVTNDLLIFHLGELDIVGSLFLILHLMTVF